MPVRQWRHRTTVGLIWLLTLVNMQGPRAAGVAQVDDDRVQAAAADRRSPACGRLLRVGAPRAIRKLVAAPITGGGIAGAAALALFAMIGFESATLPVGKIAIRNAPYPGDHRRDC